MMAASKNIEVWQDYDRAGEWCLHIRKKRGTLTLEEIQQTAMRYDQGFYFLLIKAIDEDIGQYYDTDDIDGDYVTLYRYDDFSRWRERR